MVNTKTLTINQLLLKILIISVVYMLVVFIILVIFNVSVVALFDKNMFISYLYLYLNCLALASIYAILEYIFSYQKKYEVFNRYIDIYVRGEKYTFNYLSVKRLEIISDFNSIFSYRKILLTDNNKTKTFREEKKEAKLIIKYIESVVNEGCELEFNKWKMNEKNIK